MDFGKPNKIKEDCYEKPNKIIGLLRKLQLALPKSSSCDKRYL